MDRFFPSPSGSTTTLAPSKHKRAAVAPTANASPTSGNLHLSQPLDPDAGSSPPPHSPSAPKSPVALPDSPAAPKSPPSHSRTSSESSSDSDVPYIKRPIKMAAPSTNLLIPAVEHHSLHHAPILTAGVPTPAVLLEFEDACEDFFANAKGGVRSEERR